MIFPLILQTIITAQMMSIREEGEQQDMCCRPGACTRQAKKKHKKPSCCWEIANHTYLFTVSN